jgi:hypothetical protein
MAYQFKDGTYTYIVKVNGFDDVVEVASSSKQAKYKAFKACREAGYCYSWLQFQKLVISAKRFKSKDLEC